MKKTPIMLGMVAALATLPFLINHGGGYGGPDGEAESRIQVIALHYEPWLQSLCKPASDEIESLLFTLRGSLDAAMIFCIPGYTKGR